MRTIVHAGRLIAHPGQPPQESMSVLIEDGVVCEVTDGFVDDVPAQIVDLRRQWVVPGLIDTHVHITTLLEMPASPKFTHSPLMGPYTQPPARQVLRAVTYARNMLNAGFTTVRNLGDAGGTFYELRDAVAEGIVPGPRMVGVQAQLTVSGGDYDTPGLRICPHLEPVFAPPGIFSGVDEARREVRREVQRGADVIKLRISGGGLAGVGLVEYEEEVAAVVEAAHRLNRRVAVHACSPDGILLALRCGADSIEHGPLPTDSHDLFGTTSFCPTLVAYAKNADQMKGFFGTDPLPSLMDAARAAYQAGVSFVFGSDAGAFPHEEAVEEFALLARCGLPNDEILKTATVNAALAIDMAGQVGTLAPGAFADLVATGENPLESITALERLTLVMKDGNVVARGTPG